MNAITFIQELKDYLDLKQLARLSILNNEYKDAVEFYMPEHIIKNIQNKHDIILDDLYGSQINMIELYNLLNNLVYIRDRKPYQKYKKLLIFNKLFKNNVNTDDALEKTCKVLNSLYIYTYTYCSYELQPYTYTDLLQIIGCLYIDFICRVYNLKHSNLFKRIFINKNREFKGDIFYHCNRAQISILSFYTMFTKIADKNIKNLDDYINSINWNISTENTKQCASFMHVWIQTTDILKYIIKNTEIVMQYTSRIVNITMIYIFDIYTKKICNISNNFQFMNLCKKKAIEFLNESTTNKLKPLEFKNIFNDTMEKFAFLL